MNFHHWPFSARYHRPLMAGTGQFRMAASGRKQPSGVKCSPKTQVSWPDEWMDLCRGDFPQ